MSIPFLIFRVQWSFLDQLHCILRSKQPTYRFRSSTKDRKPLHSKLYGLIEEILWLDYYPFIKVELESIYFVGHNNMSANEYNFCSQHSAEKPNVAIKTQATINFESALISTFNPLVPCTTELLWASASMCCSDFRFHQSSSNHRLWYDLLS